MLRGVSVAAGLALALATGTAGAETPPTGSSLIDEALPDEALRVGQLEVRARARLAASNEAAFDARARLHARIVALMRHLASVEEGRETQRFEETLTVALKLRTLMKRLASSAGESNDGADSSETAPAPASVPASAEDVNAVAVPNGLAPEPAEWSLPGGSLSPE